MTSNGVLPFGAVVLLVLVLASPAHAQTGLVGHWKLDEIGQDARIADASPNGLHGILGAATADRSVDVKTGRAIRFPAAGSIRLGQNAAALGRLTDFSVSMWIQYDGGASRQLFTLSDDTMNHRVQMEVHNGRLHFSWQNGGSFTGFATGELSWTPGQWYHVAFINDGVKGKTIIRSNDAAHAKHADTTGPLGLNRRIARVEIGSLCGSYPFNGCIDDVRLYNTALSKADVAALFTNKPVLVAGVADVVKLPKPSPPETTRLSPEQADGLLAHWELDDKGPNQRVVDSSGNEFHALCNSQASAASVPGKIRRAFRFPDAGLVRFDYPPAALTNLTDFTLSLWYQPSSDCWQFHQRLFAFGGSGYRMEIDKGAVNIQWRDGNVSRRVSTPVLKWKGGQWYHLVFVNNSKTGKTILRSNDLAWAMDPDAFAPAQVSASIKRIELGCRNSVRGACAFIGCIDDFSHYNSPPPIGNPRAQCMDLGAVDDVRLYKRPFSLEEQLAIYDSAQSDPQEAGRSEALAVLKRRISTVSVSPYRYFQEKVKPKLSGMELELKSEWLFQAENEELGSRIKKEITWTSELLARLRKRAPAVDLSAEMNALSEIIPKAAALTAESEASRVLALYFQLRQVKRQILFKSPEVDFSKIICVDSPVPGGNESLTRGEMHNRNDARLLVLDDIAGTVTPRQLVPAPDSNDSVALFRFDLSHDAQRVVFSMKPQKERAYHLYEVGIDGNDFRQITSGTYSDIDPIYLPQGGYAFLSTRGEVYVQCGPWARSYVLTRCDAKGSNIYLLSPGTEAEYSPSLLDDGRILYTRWEYVDKGPQRIQSLWTMRPDGTAVIAFWGNQSVWPDHLGDARQIPGTTKVLFKATSHHEFSAGCIGIVDPKEGVNYPDGIWKVTQELPWPEVGEGPIPIPGAATAYHTSGQYVTYHTPYPLSEQLFLVSAGRGWRELLYSEPEGANRLFLMDIYGNRELIYQGRRGILCAQPVRPRKAPFSLADTADFPGSEKNHPVVRPGVFFSKDIYENAPPEIRKHGKFLRVVESMPKNYSTGRLSVGGKRFGAPGPNVAWTPGTGESLVSGPATGLSAPLAVKQVLGTVPIRPDGSVQFEAPPCRMLYFQVLDKEQRCVHTMRSWVSVRPGEYRGCVGCHELRSQAPAPQWRDVNRDPDQIQSPPWGVRSLSYIKDIQPIFDRACGQCHQGQGEAVKNLDLTLRPARDPGSFGGIFPEPYLTLMMGKGWRPVIWTGWKTTGYLAVPPVPKTRYDTLPPLSCLSPKSRLISEAMDKNRCGKFIKPEEIQMLIAWIDLWGLYRSDEDCREIEDPPAAAFRNWGYPPKCKSAARVRPEYSQDEYSRPEDRLPKTKQ